MPLESTALAKPEVTARPTFRERIRPTTQSFLSALATAILLLSLSGAMLLVGFLAWHIMRADHAVTDPVSWRGDKLTVVQGRGGAVDRSLEVQALPEELGIVSSGPMSLDAASYPLLRWSLAGLHPELDAEFMWRTADDPRRVQTAALPWSGDGEQVLSLAQYSAWQGTITELGIALHGKLRKPVIIERLELMPISASGLLGALWSEWTAFEGWSGHSINFIRGGPSKGLVRPVPAAAAWVGLALLLYAGWTALRRRRWNWRVAGTAFLIGWIALDTRWQLDLLRQLQETYHRYAGKTWEEKHLAAEDGDLFQFISEVKERLPAEPQRVFMMIRDMGGQDQYTFLRALYHLLPHNVLGLGYYFTGLNQARKGDYVLSLDPAPDSVKFDRSARILSWGPRQQLRAELVFSAPLGSLYRVN